MKKHIWIFITILVFALDRVTKILVLDYLPLGEPINILPIFNLFFTFNTGAAFSFLEQADGWQEWLFKAIAVGVSVSLIIWQFKITTKHLWLKTALALIIGGICTMLFWYLLSSVSKKCPNFSK